MRNRGAHPFFGRNVSGAAVTINPGGGSYPLVVNSGF
jgi:hypothetical protein